MEYAMREVDGLTCGCEVRTCKWGRYILDTKHGMSAAPCGKLGGKHSWVQRNNPLQQDLDSLNMPKMLKRRLRFRPR